MTNWEFARPLLEARFTLHAIARRGRGETERIVGHGLDDEAIDVATLIASRGGSSVPAGLKSRLMWSREIFLRLHFDEAAARTLELEGELCAAIQLMDRRRR